MLAIRVLRKRVRRWVQQWRRWRQKKLVLIAADLSRILRPKSCAREKRSEAAGLSKGLDSKKWWRSWRELIEIHQVCDSQVRALEEVMRTLDKAARLKMSEDTYAELVNPIRRALGDEETSSRVEDIVKNGESCWRAVRESVGKKIPDVLLIHAFLRVAELGRVQVATLFSGLLVFLGAAFTETFYRAAIEGSVFRFVTLEDFLDEGVRGLYLFVAFLAVAEAILWLVRKFQNPSHEWSYRTHWWILRHPFRVAAGALLLLTAGSSLSGWFLGKGRQGEFFRMSPEEIEVATVMDGTVLRDVYLVGTTSRTATFLQVCDWGLAEPESGERYLGRCERGGPADWSVDRETVVAAAGSGLVGARHVQSGRVLVMDRALLVCHAGGEACVDQERRELDRPEGEGVKRLLNRLDVLARSDELEAQERRLREELRRSFERVDEHMNRHRDQIVWRIRNPDGP